jgi:hypothetical protein
MSVLVPAVIGGDPLDEAPRWLNTVCFILAVALAAATWWAARARITEWVGGPARLQAASGLVEISVPVGAGHLVRPGMSVEFAPDGDSASPVAGIVTSVAARAAGSSRGSFFLITARLHRDGGDGRTARLAGVAATVPGWAHVHIGETRVRTALAPALR